MKDKKRGEIMMQYSELEPASLVKIIKWVRKELKKEDSKKKEVKKLEK